MQFLNVQFLLCIGSPGALTFWYISHGGEGKLAQIPYLETVKFASFYFDAILTDYLILKTQGFVQIIYDGIHIQYL